MIELLPIDNVVVILSTHQILQCKELYAPVSSSTGEAALRSAAGMSRVRCAARLPAHVFNQTPNNRRPDKLRSGARAHRRGDCRAVGEGSGACSAASGTVGAAACVMCAPVSGSAVPPTDAPTPPGSAWRSLQTLTAKHLPVPLQKASAWIFAYRPGICVAVGAVKTHELDHVDKLPASVRQAALAD